MQPRAATIAALSAALGVSADWLLGRTEIMEIEGAPGYSPEILALAEQLSLLPDGVVEAIFALARSLGGEGGGQQAADDEQLGG